MPTIDRWIAIAFLVAVAGTVCVRALVSWADFRRTRKTNELLEKALQGLERERLGKRG